MTQHFLVTYNCNNKTIFRIIYYRDAIQITYSLMQLLYPVNDSGKWMLSRLVQTFYNPNRTVPAQHYQDEYVCKKQFITQRMSYRYKRLNKKHRGLVVCHLFHHLNCCNKPYNPKGATDRMKKLLKH